MSISIEEALNIIYETGTVVPTEIIPIEMALGRILAKDCVAAFDLPRFDNSSMDGYAVKYSDAGQTVTSKAALYAGDAPDIILEEHEAIRIMTGAPVPKGTDAIVPMEDVEVKGRKVILPQNIRRGAHIRKAGEDLKNGTLFLEKGDKITTYKIILLVSQGITHVEVYRPLNIVVFSSGDELRSHYETIEAHQLYNSNTPMFLSRAKELGCEVQALPSVTDTVDALEEAILSALHADIIITSGGMNAGDKDFTKEAFINCGTRYHFTRVNVKPGAPIAFGKIQNTSVINLPGNPLGGMVIYELFIRALIHKMSGEAAYFHHTITTEIGEDFFIRPGKYLITLGAFDGSAFFPLKNQRPGMLSVMQEAQAMMVTTPTTPSLQKGDRVKIIPLSWEFFAKEKMDFFTQ